MYKNPGKGNGGSSKTVFNPGKGSGSSQNQGHPLPIKGDKGYILGP